MLEWRVGSAPLGSGSGHSCRHCRQYPGGGGNGFISSQRLSGPPFNGGSTAVNLCCRVGYLVRSPRPPSCRRLTASVDDPSCPRAALLIVAALPNVRDAARFQLVRATYIDTVKRLAPTGAQSCMHCWLGVSQSQVPQAIAACVPRG